MVVCIETNRPEYGNDLAEEVRLFLGFADVLICAASESCEADLHFSVILTRTGDAYELFAALGDDACRDAFHLDAPDRLTRKKMEKRSMKRAIYTLLKRRFPDCRPPWGSLTGIRPTKLLRELSTALGPEAAREQFRTVFDVSERKTALAEEIVSAQASVIASAGARDADVYIGVPYCKTRCLYCSFGSLVPKRGEELDAYLDALMEDISLGARLLSNGGWRLRASYFGGGTPTILSAAQLERLLAHAAHAFHGFGTELTVEAGRPDTIDAEKLSVLKDFGVSRISINPQTMNDETLRRIGRTHTVRDVKGTFALARKMGFDWINMDLIAGLPGETVADMAESCRQIERLNPENLTVHALAIKRASRLKTVLDSYPLPSAEEAEEMIRLGAQAASNLGMRPYYLYRQKYMRGNLENVGYAKPERICAYNIDMMEETLSILSCGAGSMTKRVYSGESRIERVPSPKDVPTYRAKLPALYESKRALFLD